MLVPRLHEYQHKVDVNKLKLFSENMKKPNERILVWRIHL